MNKHHTYEPNYTNEEGPSGPFFLRNIEKKLLVDHIKSTNSFSSVKGLFCYSPFLWILSPPQFIHLILYDI